MELKPVKSSNFKALGHDKETEELHIEFQGGSVFAYDGISEELYLALMDAESKGKFFHEKIKNGGFKYRKIK